jgi:glycerol kinase
MPLFGKIAEQQNIVIKKRPCRDDSKKDRTSFRRLFSGTKVKWILDNVPGAEKKQSKESYVLEL